jgi:hypothetical protein
MVDFVLVDNPFKNMNDYLIKKIIAFKSSPEYNEMVEYEKNNNSVVCSVFTTFFERLLKEQQEKELNGEENNSLNNCFEIINELASASHPQGQRMLNEIILYNLSLENNYMRLLYSKFNQDARRIYDSLLNAR